MRFAKLLMCLIPLEQYVEIQFGAIETGQMQHAFN